VSPNWYFNKTQEEINRKLFIQKNQLMNTWGMMALGNDHLQPSMLPLMTLQWMLNSTEWQVPGLQVQQLDSLLITNNNNNNNKKTPLQWSGPLRTL
jgi:hypothetical protein